MTTLVLVLGLVAAGWLLYTDSRAATLDHVDRLPQRTLEREARRVATHGGILGTCSGCATPYMKRLSRELVERAFVGVHRAWALCITDRESGDNPGAISATNDHSLPQFNEPTWRKLMSFTRLRIDPAYAVRMFVRVSDHGRYRRPWDGGAYSCP